MSEISGYDFLADDGGRREEAPEELGGQDPSLNGAMEPEVTSSASEPEQVEDQSTLTNLRLGPYREESPVKAW